MVPEPVLTVACSSGNALQRYLPAVFTIENFWRLRGKRDFTLVQFPRELCRIPDKKTRYAEPPQESDGTQTLQLSIRIAIVELDGTLSYIDDQELPSVLVLSSNYWLSLSRGQPIKLLVNFLRLPIDYEGTACKFVFEARLHNRSGVDVMGEVTLQALSSSPSSAVPSNSKKSLKRSSSGDSDREEGTTKKKKTHRSKEGQTIQWEEFFLNCGLRDSSDISAYASIMKSQRITDRTELARVPIELLQQLGFKLNDIARIREHLFPVYNPSHNSDSNSDSEADSDGGSPASPSPAPSSPSSSSSSSSSSYDEDVEFSDYEEEIAVRLLLLYESNPPSPSAIVMPSSSIPTSPSPIAVPTATPSVSITTSSVTSVQRTPTLSMNQVVHQTIKLGKLIICEVKDPNDPSSDLKNRLILAEEVEKLLNQWVSMMYPSQPSLSLEDVREMTEQPSPPYDLPLAYYVKVFSLHLQLKDNNRGILKREHLLLPMEDVAKLLGLSLTKISREYQRGSVLTCGWLLKGRKRSLRWPSRPLHVLLGHISEKILRETPTLEASLFTPSLSPSPSFSSPSSSPTSLSPGILTRSQKPQTHLALLASTATKEPSSPPRHHHQLINCY